MLKIDLEPGESVKIGDNITVWFEQKSGQRARLAFDADRSIPIKKIPKSTPESAIVARNGLTGLEKVA